MRHRIVFLLIVLLLLCTACSEEAALLGLNNYPQGASIASDGSTLYIAEGASIRVRPSDGAERLLTPVWPDEVQAPLLGELYFVDGQLWLREQSADKLYCCDPQTGALEQAADGRGYGSFFVAGGQPYATGRRARSTLYGWPDGTRTALITDLQEGIHTLYPTQEAVYYINIDGTLCRLQLDTGVVTTLAENAAYPVAEGDTVYFLRDGQLWRQQEQAEAVCDGVTGIWTMQNGAVYVRTAEAGAAVWDGSALTPLVSESCVGFEVIGNWMRYYLPNEGSFVLAPLP